MNAPWIRRAILGAGLLGALLFGTALLASFLDPLLVERIGREIIRMQVQKKVDERIEAIDEKFLARQAGRFTKGYAEQIETNKRLLRAKAPERIAAIMAKMQNLDCECRRKTEARLRGLLEGGIASAEQAMQSLNKLIRGQYQDTAQKITREFRIFTGVNALVYAALLAAGLLRPLAGVHLLPAALVLLGASLVTAAMYLFGQNWLLTIVFGSYVGWAYLLYLAVVFLFLSDIVFNRGRITRLLLECMGSGTVVSSC